MKYRGGWGGVEGQGYRGGREAKSTALELRLADLEKCLRQGGG